MGGEDVGLLLSLCDANGKLLKPDKPARSVDAVWTSLVPGAAKGPPGTLWSTSVTKSNATWGYVLAARTSTKWTADAKTLGLPGKTDGYSWIREQTSIVAVPIERLNRWRVLVQARRRSREVWTSARST